MENDGRTGGGRGGLTALFLLCALAFLIYGMYFNGMGTDAPAVMAFFGIGESRQGLILTVQAVGCLGMAVLLGLFGERLNKLLALSLGLGLMGAAGLLIGTLPVYTPQGRGYGLMLAYSLLGGIGYITVDLLMNGVVADMFPEKKNTLLPFIHAFYGAGAMLAPLFVTACAVPAAPATFARPYLFLGCAAGAVCLALAGVTFRLGPRMPYGRGLFVPAGETQHPAEIFADRRAWLYLGACFLYLCFQTGLSAWLPRFGMAQLGLSYGDAAGLLTLYFLGALAMRFLSPAIYRRIPVRRFYVGTLLLSAAVFLPLVLMPLPLGAQRALMVLLGLLQGASVPAMVILCCDAFPERTASASAVVVLSVSLAALIVPGVMGKLIEVAGYTTPMLLICACLPASAALAAVVERAA